jgi:hypothetical protein
MLGSSQSTYVGEHPVEFFFLHLILQCRIIRFLRKSRDCFCCFAIVSSSCDPALLRNPRFSSIKGKKVATVRISNKTSSVSGDQYGGTYQNWQQNAPPPPDHVVNMHARPPPPPPLHAHSSGSASNNSCSEGGRRPPLTPAASYAFSRSATFTYEELAAATDGFSDANLLGQGGFGYVHKGVLPNGKEVAVKQLRDGSGQGEREFQAEVEIISRVHHRHLVSLVGYCISGDKRLLLVYEFVPNNTLEFHLHGMHLFFLYQLSHSECLV